MPRYTWNTLFGVEVKKVLTESKDPDKPALKFKSNLVPTMGNPSRYKHIVDFCGKYFELHKAGSLETKIIRPILTIDIHDFTQDFMKAFPDMVIRVDKVWDCVIMSTPDNAETYLFEGIPVYWFEVNGRRYHMTHIAHWEVVEKLLRETGVFKA